MTRSASGDASYNALTEFKHLVAESKVEYCVIKEKPLHIALLELDIIGFSHFGDRSCPGQYVDSQIHDANVTAGYGLSESRGVDPIDPEEKESLGIYWFRLGIGRSEVDHCTACS